MFEEIQEFIKGLVSTFQLAKIYTPNHPKFKEGIDSAFSLLEGILKYKNEIIIGIVEDEIVFEKEIFFELSKRLKIFIDYLKKYNIEKIIFKRGITKEEFIKFIDFISFSIENTDNISNHLLVIGVKNISIEGLKIKDNKKITDFSYLELYKETEKNFSGYIEKILNMEDTDLINLKFFIFNLIEHSLTNFSDFLKISLVKEYEIETYNHILDVAILAGYFAYKLSYSQEIIKDITIAGLLHDIGKIYISKKIISKQGKLTDEEYEIVKNHAVFGSRLLVKYTNTLGILPVVVAFEHHIGFDKSGYPKVDSDYNVSCASLIVSICDVYDALIKRRRYKREYSPIFIYDFMKSKSGRFFDPYLLDKFFKIFGVWPTNTIVRLSDGRIAIVRQQNEDDIFSPKVEIVSPKEGKIIDLKENRDIKIKDFLSPFLEGKEYISLI